MGCIYIFILLFINISSYFYYLLVGGSYYYILEHSPTYHWESLSKITIWRFLAGFAAGIVSTTLTHPIDVLRARLAIDSRQSILQAWQTIKQDNAYFKGLRPTLLTIGPFMGI